MRHVVLIIVVGIVFAPWHARRAAAQGMLHKSRHVAGVGMGAMRPLPTQASPAAVAATGAVPTAEGATIATIGSIPASPSTVGGVPGAVGGAPGVMPICIVTPAPIDGVRIGAVPMPMPSVDGGPPIACVDYPGIQPGFDPGSTVSIGGWPDTSGPHPIMVTGGPASPPPGMHHDGRWPLMVSTAGGRGGHATAMSANAFGETTAAAASGRAVAAGLPGRAVGVRPGALDVPGPRQMAAIAIPAPDSSTAASATRARRDPGVIQAAGSPPQRERASQTVGHALPGATTAASAAAAPPRWRDRLRFAWPTTK